MRRYQSDSAVLHIVKCRLCKERSMQNGDEFNEGGHISHCDDITTVPTTTSINTNNSIGTASTNIGLAIKQKQEPNIIEEDKKPNKQQSTLMNKQQQSTSSSLDKQQSTSNSLSAKLAKILSTWPFAQLQEVAKHNTNISADGEFVEACKKEMERRQKNYQEWRKQSDADYLC